jgi:DNA-binding MarR family transcriptional regulator
MMTPQERPLGVIAVFRRTARLMVAELLDRLEAIGYSDMLPAFNAVFANIEPDGIRLTELAARSEMTHQSMSELVGILEQRGYVERRPDPSDGRARLVCLTAEGRELRTIGNAHIKEIEADWQQRWQRAGIGTDLRAALETALHEAERSRGA